MTFHCYKIGYTTLRTTVTATLAAEVSSCISRYHKLLLDIPNDWSFFFLG